MSRRLPLHLLTGMVLICFYAVIYNALLQERGDAGQIAHSGSGIWNLPPVALLAIAGEFKGVMADYLTLEAGAQLGSELVRDPEGGFRVVEKQYDWPNIHRLFVASQILDPSFAQTYIVAQGWLPWEPANMVPETQEILNIAAKNRPWDWQPFHAMGFNTYYFLEQPGEAGKIFLEAAKIPNSPTFLSILGARLALKGEETETAILLLQSILQGKSEEEPGYEDIVQRLNALQGTLILARAAEVYEKQNGHIPSSVIQLVTSGLLLELPNNPYGLDYCIDTTGVVHFDNPKCRDIK